MVTTNNFVIMSGKAFDSAVEESAGEKVIVIVLSPCVWIELGLIPIVAKQKSEIRCQRFIVTLVPCDIFILFYGFQIM
jgi:hypothetical protein